MLKLANIAEPPLRLFSGIWGLPIVRWEYAESLADWEKWNARSLGA
jgi:hypothetical protein